MNQKPEMREPTPQEMQALRDLCDKAMHDVRAALNTTLDLASSLGGNAAIFLLTQRMAATFVTGAATSFQAMRDGADSLNDDRSRHGVNHDNILFIALLAYGMETNRRPEIAFDAANDLFKKLKGYEHKMPPNIVRA